MATTNRGPAQVRNLMEVRVRKLANSYDIKDQVDVTVEMINILEEFLVGRLDLMKKRNKTS